jgi:ABC-type transport system substrate-binding protein
MKLGYRIYTQMKALGLTQAELAEKSGLSQQIISNYINDKFKPGYDAILGLSGALEVDPAWFFDARAPTGDIIAFGKVQRGGTLKIGQLLPMDNLPSPISLNRETGIVMNLYWLIFDALTRGFTYREPKAGIAYNWKQGGEYWIFDIFSNVTFHNGQICTAADVDYSYQKWMSHNEEKNPIKRTQVIDAHTFLMELKKECKLSDIPMPFIVPRGNDYKDYSFVGTGPFKSVEIQPDFWKLQAHKGYHRGGAFLDEVVVKRYQNPTELENALKKEQVNVAVGIDLKDKRFNVKTEPLVQRYELVFRLDSPLCRDVRFRKALYYGLNRATIAKAAGLRKPLFAKGAFDYVLDERNELPEKPDIQKAKQLLSDIPNINETQLSFEISSAHPKEEMIVREIITQLNAFSIQTEIVQHKAALAVVLLNTRTPYLERQIWKKDGIANISGYYNPYVEMLLDNLTDVSTDSTLLKEIQTLIEKDCPSVPLFYDEAPITYVKNLRALEDRMILMTILSDIHTWYFEQETELIQLPKRIEREREAEAPLPAVG